MYFMDLHVINLNRQLLIFYVIFVLQSPHSVARIKNLHVIIVLMVLLAVRAFSRVRPMSCLLYSTSQLLPPRCLQLCHHKAFLDVIMLSIAYIQFFSIVFLARLFYQSSVCCRLINHAETHGRNVVDIVVTTYETRGQKGGKRGVLSFGKVVAEFYFCS